MRVPRSITWLLARLPEGSLKQAFLREARPVAKGGRIPYGTLSPVILGFF